MTKRRVRLMVVASWALATALTGLVVWRAVAVLDDGTRTDVLSGAQVSGLLASASPTPGTTTSSGTSVTTSSAPSSSPTVLTATPSASSDSAAAPTNLTKPGSASTATKPPAQAPTPIARTWNVPGGTVNVACTGQAISLSSASPANGWRVKIETGGPDRIKLAFTSGEQETEVGGSCVAGVPQQSTIAHD